MTRLVVACGGRAETMAGLAGLGDLVLTCTGGLSRNRSVGVELGRGRKLPDIIAGMHGMVAEGVFTTTAAVGLAHARGVEMPITEQMHAILHQGKSPREAIQELMARSGKSETGISFVCRPILRVRLCPSVVKDLGELKIMRLNPGGRPSRRFNLAVAILLIASNSLRPNQNHRRAPRLSPRLETSHHPR